MFTGLVAQASNIKRDNDVQYSKSEFLAYYPQFSNLVPDIVLGGFLELANACVSQDRYGKMWKLAIGLFVAHFCALWLQNISKEGSSTDDVLQSCKPAGIVTSESADGVSYSMDLSLLNNDLNGWAAYKLTTYGVQFATIAKLVGKGGIYVW
jgi:hypothetical protein